MATEVKLPDLGEGVEDAAISRWLVKEGDTVSAGDVIVEVATDKVDTEVPAPAAGTILKLMAGEGEIVDLSAVLAVIGEEGEEVESGTTPAADEAPAAQEDAAPAQDSDATATQPAASTATQASQGQTASNTDDVKATPVAKRVAQEKGISLSGLSGSGPGGQITKDDVLAQADGGSAEEATGEALPGALSDIAPLEVRRLAADYNVSLDEVADGRPLSSLTRYDVLNAVAARSGQAAPSTQFLPPKGFAYGAPNRAEESKSNGAATQPAAAAKAAAATPSAPKASEARQVSSAVEVVKPNRMRQLIAQNTFESLQSSPQLTTWHDVDMTAVINHRKAHKAEFAANGVNLTVTAYLIAATVEGLKAVPAANSRWTDDGIAIYRTFNIGMAAAMPADKYGLGGLIVPVIKNAGELNLLGIARQVNELAEKARGNKITGQDLQDGTFTVTNYGTSGSVFQTPIIHQGQAGILGTGAIEKRPVVVSNGSPLAANLGDYLSFKPMMTLAFTFDHRVLDGATADAFCVAIKQALEHWQ
ncbi:MAG: 2-oxo acid dehydrogenase subunit E2 [Caldilineaceae bacterium]|nr:2-oxo acid dehydrogenase subunit E2 [Caldilineaceae bacterium]